MQVCVLASACVSASAAALASVMVEFLVQNEVGVLQRAALQDDKELRYTPLQVAVKFSQRDTVETLLRHSADSTVTDKNAVTPLIDAVYENSEKIVTLLVSSLCSALEKNTSDMLHAQLLNAIGAVFDHANPTVIMAFAQGLVSTRSIVELLPRAELLKFLNAPLKTPLIVLQACFTRQSLAYVDQGRRTILSGTYITRYGDLRVKLGAHHQRITELYHEKVDIPRSLLRSITNLAPQEPEIPSQPYMTASFWMCSIPHVDTDTDVLQALLKGELDNFGDWRVTAIVQLLWDQAKVAHRNTQVLHLLNINFWTALNFSLWGKEKFVEETSVILTKCLLSAVAFLWLMELMQMVAYFAGHARIAKHGRYLRSLCGV